MQQKNDKNRKRNAENTRGSTNVEQNCAAAYLCKRIRVRLWTEENNLKPNEC